MMIKKSISELSQLSSGQFSSSFEFEDPTLAAIQDPQSLTGEQAECFAHLHHTHVTEMQQMFGSQTAPTEDTPPERTSDNLCSAPIEKPIIQSFVPPTLSKFQQKKR